MMSEPKRIRETTKKGIGWGWAEGGLFFVVFILSSPFSLRRWRDTRCLLSGDGGGIRGGDAGRMLIKQNANWKSRKETQATTPPFQHQPTPLHPHPPTHLPILRHPHSSSQQEAWSLKSSNQVVIVSQLNSADFETLRLRVSEWKLTDELIARSFKWHKNAISP